MLVLFYIFYIYRFFLSDSSSLGINTAMQACYLSLNSSVIYFFTLHVTRELYHHVLTDE